MCGITVLFTCFSAAMMPIEFRTGYYHTFQQHNNNVELLRRDLNELKLQLQCLKNDLSQFQEDYYHEENIISRNPRRLYQNYIFFRDSRRFEPIIEGE